MKIIEVKNLKKKYQLGDLEVNALRGVSFDIDKGQFSAIMGPSGSGKSTLMHIIGCLDSPTSGEYLLNGKNVAEMSEDQLASIRNKDIGFVFQKFHLLPRSTALENVVLPLKYAKVDKNQGIDHFYLLGKPVEQPKGRVIPPPFSAKKRYQISQGFNGRYSHTGQGNRYAIDIAMAIGESVNAVMPGIVADARDDFSMGGAANYFLDKANHITIMHEDGSYAIYAHILYGSLEVSIGDQVKQGQKLARVGNTGFSTGPHLHFVMRYNSGAGAYSIPFKLDTDKGIKLPREGRYYSPRLMNKN